MSEYLRIVLGAIYFVLAGCSAWVFHREYERSETKRSSLVWAGLTVVLAVLAFFTMTEVGQVLVNDFRQEARAEGWYLSRRPMQARVIVGILVGAVLGYGALIVRLRHKLSRYLGAITASAYLMALDSVRLVSLHQVDHLMGLHVGFLTVGGLLQLIGLLLVSLALYRGMALLNPRRSYRFEAE